MSKLVFSIEEVFCGLFKGVSSSFAGVYESDNEDVKNITNEMFNRDIPTSHQDRVNLRNDASKVSGDYKKAFDMKKSEHCEI